ncbi:MAG: hypothetical protein JWN70_3014 [Planctomycetaceae bacterium]|nr:hypothetical protein [Planctomycetaceae bacterium]
MTAVTPRISRDNLITAAVLPLIYLFMAISTIIECASGGNVYLRWYSAAVMTIPVSAVAEIFVPDYSPGLVGFLVFAILNACGIFLICYVAVRIWNRVRAAGWSIHPSYRASIILSLSAYALWKLQGPVIYRVNGMCGPLIAMPLSAVAFVLVVGLAVAAIRLWPSTPA